MLKAEIHVSNLIFISFVIEPNHKYYETDTHNRLLPHPILLLFTPTSIQPEILYTNSGGEFIRTQGNHTVSYTAKFDKVDVPIMAGFKIAEFFRLQAGPTIAFILDSDLSSNASLPVKPDYNKATIAYQAGIGLDIANFILDLKYEGPLGKIAKSYVGLPTDQRQNQIILSLGIRLF